MQNKKENKPKAVVFGAGGFGKSFVNNCLDKYDFIAFCDNDKSKIGNFLNGLSIIRPEDIFFQVFDLVIVASMWDREIFKQLTDMGLKEDKIHIPCDTHDTQFEFVRKKITAKYEPVEKTELAKISNLLEYTKASGQKYSARIYPAGYHTIKLFGKELKGQRDPKKRIEKTPFDFYDKTVLDIGSNQGAMLFELADKIKWGVGLDYDYRMVNVANRISHVIGGKTNF